MFGFGGSKEDTVEDCQKLMKKQMEEFGKKMEKKFSKDIGVKVSDVTVGYAGTDQAFDGIVDYEMSEKYQARLVLTSEGGHAFHILYCYIISFRADGTITYLFNIKPEETMKSYSKFSEALKAGTSILKGVYGL